MERAPLRPRRPSVTFFPGGSGNEGVALRARCRWHVEADLKLSLVSEVSERLSSFCGQERGMEDCRRPWGCARFERVQDVPSPLRRGLAWTGGLWGLRVSRLIAHCPRKRLEQLLKAGPDVGGYRDVDLLVLLARCRTEAFVADRAFSARTRLSREVCRGVSLRALSTSNRHEVESLTVRTQQAPLRPVPNPTRPILQHLPPTESLQLLANRFSHLSVGRPKRGIELVIEHGVRNQQLAE